VVGTVIPTNLKRPKNNTKTPPHRHQPQQTKGNRNKLGTWFCSFNLKINLYTYI